MRKHSIKKNGLKIATGVLAFAAGLAATFFFVPGRVNILKFDEPEAIQAEDTYFSRFVSKLSPIISGDDSEDSSDSEAFGLKADLTTFEISWPGNKVVVGGEINANIKSLKDLDITVDLDVNYNNKNIDLAVGYVDETLYVATKDLKLKTCFVDDKVANAQFIDMFRKIKSLFFDTSNEDGLQIDLQLGEILGTVIGGIDTSSLGGGISFTVEENEDDEFAYSTLKLSLDESTNIEIEMSINKNELSLQKVVVKPVTIGDISIKAELKCETSPDMPVYALDDPNYAYKQRGSFIETFNYTSWIDSIFNLLKTRTVGLDITASLTGADTSYGIVDASIDLDASRFAPLNLVGTVIGPELFGLSSLEAQPEEESFIKNTEPANTENSIISMINNFDFNVAVKLANMKKNDLGVFERVDYSNINVAYFLDADEANNGYITLNEENDNAVMKAKVDIPTINFLIDEIPNLINKLSKETVSEANKEETSLFDFVTSSELITAVQDGHYEAILDLIENLKSTEKTIEISINLGLLGFGDDAKLNIVLDANQSNDAPTKVLNISVENAKIGDLVLNANISTRKFNKGPFDRINETRNTFDNLDFVSGTLKQVEEIIDTTKARINLEGSALDENSLGFMFNGWAQLDYNQKQGFGHVQFDEYKYSPTKAQTPHTVDISIDDFDGDHSKNDMFFEYRETLRGKFTLKTFDDIIDVVMKLIEVPDTRFTKFLQPILDKIFGSVLVSAISSKDYLALSQSSLIKSVKQTSDTSLDIVLSKELLMDLLPDDLTLRINFKNDTVKGKILSSIEVVNLNALGKTINAKISLVDYVENQENPVDLSKKFLDFSDIAVLLEFGINTTELTYFHLTANVSLKIKFLLWNINISKIALDFHIYVNGVTTKVYGKMADNPLKKSSSEMVFEPSHSDDDLVGGTFHILRQDKSLFGDSDTYYVTSSDNFVDNILKYLLGGFLGLDSGLVNGIDNLDLSSKEEGDPQYQNIFTDTGFVYSADEANNKYTWTTGISIEAFLEKDTIAPVEATITGTKVDGVGYLSNIYAKTTLINLIPITADISLVNPDPTILDWPASIEARYQEIISKFDSLSSANQTKALSEKGYTYSV